MARISVRFPSESGQSAKRGDTEDVCEVEVRAISFRGVGSISSIKPSVVLLHC